MVLAEPCDKVISHLPLIKSGSALGNVRGAAATRFNIVVLVRWSAFHCPLTPYPLYKQRGKLDLHTHLAGKRMNQEVVGRVLSTKVSPSPHSSVKLLSIQPHTESTILNK